jgi:hypothetical protein
MNSKLIKALDIITTEAEVSVLGDDNSDPHVQKVLDALEYVSKELCLEKVTTYCRHSLDAVMSTRLGMKVKATDAQWQQVSDSIYEDDQAWDYIDEAIARAEDELINPLVDEMSKPDPSPKFKAWDYVHHVKNKNKDLESRLHIFGTVIKQENNNVWLTDDNDTCEIIRVFADELELAESPEDNVRYTPLFPTSSALEWEREAVQTLSLYPHSSSDEQAIMWRSFRRKAVKEGHKVYRRYMKPDHYHYFIPDLYVFCSENYG